MEVRQVGATRAPTPLGRICPGATRLPGPDRIATLLALLRWIQSARNIPSTSSPLLSAAGSTRSPPDRRAADAENADRAPGSRSTSLLPVSPRAGPRRPLLPP